MKIVILAGGGGTRLWPLSREDKPKQFSRIVGDKTLYEQTVARFLGEYQPDDIYVCLNTNLVEQARSLCPQIPEKNYIIEPEKRDTAPAMGLVAAFLANLFPDEPIVYVPADHYIADQEKFLKILRVADQLIRATGKMVDIAIQPTFASTVLGYTKIGAKIKEEDDVEVFEFLGHKEKPELEQAKQYLKEGIYLWHGNYYMWTPNKILNAFKENSPIHFQALEKIQQAYKENDQEAIKQAFLSMEKISFDYAITEKINPEQVLIIRGDFGWSDVGAFDVLYDARKDEADENNNVIVGNGVLEGAHDCLIYSKEGRIVAAIGVKDLVIIDTDDALLVCPKSRAQEVKKIVENLKATNLHKYS